MVQSPVYALFAGSKPFSEDTFRTLLIPETSKVKGIHIRVPRGDLKRFMSQFLKSKIVNHYLQFGISIDDLVTRRMLAFCLWAGNRTPSDFSRNVKVRALLSTNDAKYLTDLHKHLLKPIHDSFVRIHGKDFKGVLVELPANDGPNELMADSVREIFLATILGSGNGKRMSDSALHLFHALLYHDLGTMIMANQIANGDYYLSAMENIGTKGMEEIWLPGQLDFIPAGTIERMKGILRQIDPKSNLDTLLQDFHAREIVRAVAKAVTYRSGATIMKNNHGGDALAILNLDDKYIEEFTQKLVQYSDIDRKIIRTFLKGMPDRFRLCSIEGKTSEGSKTIQGLFFDFHLNKAFNFAKNDFNSYTDELSNVAMQVNLILKQYGVKSKLPTIGIFKATPLPNWDPKVLVKLDDLNTGGYRGILTDPDPEARIKEMFGTELKSILQKEDEEIRDQITKEIIKRILLPHFHIRQALFDAAVIEEFMLSGKIFDFKPSAIGTSRNRESHILVRKINASHPPKLPVRLPDGSNDFIILHPQARFFRKMGNEITIGFDLCQEREHNPFKLSEKEIHQTVFTGSGKLIEHLQEVLATHAKMRGKNKRVLFLYPDEATQIRNFIALVTKIHNGELKKVHLDNFLLHISSGHILNYFRQAIIDRLMKNEACSGLQSLFIKGNHYKLKKILLACGNLNFYNQLMEYAISTTQYPFRYDEIILPAREKIPYRISSRTRKGQSRAFQKERNSIDVEDAIQAAKLIAGAESSLHRLGLNFRRDGSIDFIEAPIIPFPFSEPYFRNNDFTIPKSLKQFINGILFSRENRWAKGVEFLRFPLSMHDNSTLQHPFQEIDFKGTIMDGWKELDKIMQIGSANSRTFSKFNSALEYNLANLNENNFQATFELCKFGPFRTQFSSIFGIVNDWLTNESLKGIDEIAKEYAGSIDHVEFSTGKTQTRVQTGNYKIAINNNNRLIWYLEAIATGYGKEVPLYFRDEKIDNLYVLTGLRPKPRAALTLSEFRVFGQSRFTKSSIKWHVHTFLEIFYRQHLIDGQQLEDLITIFEKNVFTQRRGKAYTSHRLLEGLNHKERRQQMQIIASFLNLNGVFRAPSGRFISDNKVMVATKSPISFNILDVLNSADQVPAYPTEVMAIQREILKAFLNLIKGRITSNRNT